jgi:hypothetical protein
MAGMQQAAPAAAKALHIFMPGRHVSTAGEAIEFSDADIAATAAAYDPKIHKAPIVKGHPATDAPAQGWASGLVVRPRGLYAIASKVDPAFAEEVNAGRWGTVSAKFYRPDDARNPVPGVWYLRHIGMLGAEPPAVKGMDEPEFAEADDGCVCFAEGVAFSDWAPMTQANLFRSLREWFVATFGLEQADKVLPNYDVRELELAAQEDVAARRAASGSPTAFAEGGPDPDPGNPPPPQEPTVNEQEAAQLREQNAQLQTQLKAVTDAAAAAAAREVAAAAAARTAEHTAFAESLISDGKLPEVHKARVIAFAEAMCPAGGEPVMFGEGDAAKPLLQELKDFLQDMPAGVEFGEQATRSRAGAADGGAPDVEYAEGADPERIELDKKIRAYAVKHNVDYATAAMAVTK